MPTSSDVKKALALLRRRLREAEDVMLAERRKEQELDRAYSQAGSVRPSTLPPGFLESRGK